LIGNPRHRFEIVVVFKIFCWQFNFLVRQLGFELVQEPPQQLPHNLLQKLRFRESFEFHAFPVVKFVIGLFFAIKNPKFATVWELQKMFFFIHMNNRCPP
jgi:hypothetical protein